YSSDIDGTKGFVAGKGEVEDGLDEGVFYMQTGDKAKFILPSHLAYGLMGDGDKVPSHSVLVYDVELIDIK
ncbi:MAG TPA: FKBP-type peptidyl-prolyl cis-trans isomerase, partial [Flavobacteriales bacterium]|nr:FKBP-type peptidyl-prolyl cis-trans isomerase [Flavobacteriales bacterium]